MGRTLASARTPFLLDSLSERRWKRGFALFYSAIPPRCAGALHGPHLRAEVRPVFVETRFIRRYWHMPLGPNSPELTELGALVMTPPPSGMVWSVGSAPVQWNT